jgi:ribosome recycling factor
MNEFINQAAKALDFFNSQLRGICDSNISAGFVETFRVQKTELKQIALVYEDKGRVIVIPFDRSLVPKLAKDLKDLGLNAYAFSKEQIVVNIPSRCGEQRLEIQAHIRKLAEEAKVVVRNLRKKCKQRLKATIREHEKELQKITDEATSRIDQLAKWKCENLR